MFTQPSPDSDLIVADWGMISRGRPKTELVLSSEEHERLVALVGRRKSAQALAQRARIVLQCAGGASSAAVAESEGVTVQTVGKWRRRFVHARLAGLMTARGVAHRAKLRMRKWNES